MFQLSRAPPSKSNQFFRQIAERSLMFVAFSFLRSTIKLRLTTFTENVKLIIFTVPTHNQI